jgi:hypothetical protein
MNVKIGAPEYPKRILMIAVAAFFALIFANFFFNLKIKGFSTNSMEKLEI